MPTFSPDGRALAYTSNESGRVDVARDGRLLLLRGIEGQVDASTIHVVLSFADAVRQSQR